MKSKKSSLFSLLVINFDTFCVFHVKKNVSFFCTTLSGLNPIYAPD